MSFELKTLDNEIVTTISSIDGAIHQCAVGQFYQFSVSIKNNTGIKFFFYLKKKKDFF